MDEFIRKANSPAMNFAQLSRSHSKESCAWQNYKTTEEIIRKANSLAMNFGKLSLTRKKIAHRKIIKKNRGIYPKSKFPSDEFWKAFSHSKENCAWQNYKRLR